MSLAELVNLQTQQMMMQFGGDQTGEKWQPAELNFNNHNRNESTSKATSYQTIGMAPSVQFIVTGNLGYGTNSDENTPEGIKEKNTMQKLTSIFSPQLDTNDKRGISQKILPLKAKRKPNQNISILPKMPASKQTEFEAP